MILHTGQLAYPARSLLEDLVSRTGSPTTQSLSPYNGMQSTLFAQFTRKGLEVDLNLIVAMLRKQPDYDADKQKPVAGTWSKDREAPTTYLRRLEDIDESWVRKYLENVLVGIKHNKSDGLREHQEAHREARVLVNSEGEEMEEGEGLIESDEYSPMDIAEAKSKLPYLLKRLHDKSLAMHISALSLIIAYEKARSTTKFPKPSDILAYGVYYMEKNGNLGSRLPDSANSGKVFPPASNWIRGYAQDTYFGDAMELLRVCKALSIDITAENPFDFQAEDIRNMKVTYISKNRDYLRGTRQRNHDVLNSLATVSVSDYYPTRGSAPNQRTLILNTVQAVLDCSDPKFEEEVLGGSTDIRLMNEFFRTYAEGALDFRVTKKQHFERLGSRYTASIKDPDTQLVPTVDDFVTRDGFFYDPRLPSTPLVFRVGRYTDNSMDSNIGILHASGYMCLVEGENQIHYIHVARLQEYIRDYRRGETSNKYAGNRKYGWWDSCFV